MLVALYKIRRGLDEVANGDWQFEQRRIMRQYERQQKKEPANADRTD